MQEVANSSHDPNQEEKKSVDNTHSSIVIHVDETSTATLSDKMSIEDVRHRISVLEGELAMLKEFINE